MECRTLKENMAKRPRYDKWELQRQFAEIIRNRLKMSGVTQRHVANVAGISDVHLCNVLKCKTGVRLDTMVKIYWASEYSTLRTRLRLVAT